MAAREQINPSEQLAATGTPSSTTYLRGDNTWSTPSGGGGSSTPTANTVAEWDGNVNFSANNFFDTYTSTATAAGTTALTITSDAVQVFTGTTTQTVTLPTTSVPEGGAWLIINQSTGAVTVNGSSSGTACVLAAGTSAVFTASQAAPTTGAEWTVQYGGISITSGKVVNFANTMTFTAADDGNTMVFPGYNTQYVVAPPTVASVNVSAISPGASTLSVIANLLVPAASVSAGTAFKVRAFGGNRPWPRPGIGRNDGGYHGHRKSSRNISFDSGTRPDNGKRHRQ